MESHGYTFGAIYDRAKQALMLETDRSNTLRQAIQSCRKGGTVSVPGVYGGLIDKFPIGAAFAKGLTLRMGQTHVHRYLKPLLEKIRNDEIDPSFVITHRLELDSASEGYQMFQRKEDQCIKVVMKP
jgi:threonine dehydrogenase-like Zn-dependent dehydrogenase